MTATAALLPLILFLLFAWASAAPSSVRIADSAAVSELLGRADKRRLVGTDDVAARSRLLRPDPYDEFAEPRRLDWPRRRRRLQAERIRRRVLWRIARHPDLARRQRELERLGPMKPHSRDGRLDQSDPYSEFASAAYYRFVRAILDMRNHMTVISGFDKSSAIREFFEETPPSTNGSNTTTTPPPGPTVPPSPLVQVCPPRWRLGEHRCEATNVTFCFKDAECPGSRCCFDGCKMRCLEPELLVRHVCRDYMNSSVFPGDLYMHQRTQICTCDELGRPVGCKDKKPCIDVISSSLFKMPLITDKTVKLGKRERTTRQKIYDALQVAFKNVKV